MSRDRKSTYWTAILFDERARGDRLGESEALRDVLTCAGGEGRERPEKGRGLQIGSAFSPCW
jgi:hypothetical protein